MIPYDFTRIAAKELLALPPEIRRRIIHKIEFFLNTGHPLDFAKRLTGTSRPSWRFQVNDYRIIFEREAEGILITRVGHRRSIYR